MFSFLAYSGKDTSIFFASSSLTRNTTKLPILAEEFALVAASIFLTKLVRELSILRANIIATGLPPLTQTKHWGLPAADPVTFNG